MKVYFSCVKSVSMFAVPNVSCTYAHTMKLCGAARLLLFLQMQLLCQLLHVPFRRSFCFPAAQPRPQWPRTADAGHQTPSAGTWLQESGPPAAPAWGLDQRWWCASGLADEAACCCLRGRHPGPSQHHCCHLPLTYDVCWTHRGEGWYQFIVLSEVTICLTLSCSKIHPQSVCVIEY